MDRIETIWHGIAMIAAAIGIAILTILITANKKTIGYSLGTVSNTDKGNALVITKEVDWWTDDEIILDRNISYDKAIELVNALNERLP